MKHGIHSKLSDLENPVVLFLDYNGWWAPIASLYFSSSSQVLVSRHSESCLEEITSYYCPQCLTRHMEEDIKKYQYRCPSCFQCPCCTTVLVIVALSSAECAFQCGNCNWRSDRCGLIGADKSELEIAIIEREQSDYGKDAFRVLVQYYQNEDTTRGRSSLPRPPPEPSKLIRKNNFEDLEIKFNKPKDQYDPEKESVLYEFMKSYSVPSTDTWDLAPSGDITVPLYEYTILSERLQQSSRQPINTSGLLPVRIKLRTKRIVRCRKDALEGKLSILVQPKTIPLEGDSSQKQRSKWWVKDSSAIHELPRIVIKRLPVLSGILEGDNRSSRITLEITNPKDIPILVSLRQFVEVDNISDVSASSTEETVISLEDLGTVDVTLAASLSQSLPPSQSLDTADGSLDQLVKLCKRNPAFSFPCNMLAITAPEPSFQVELEAFEDELLRDDAASQSVSQDKGVLDRRLASISGAQ